MNDDEAQQRLRVALEEFLKALPEGMRLRAMCVRPQTGQMDTGAGTVTALVLANQGDDTMRFVQVVERGLKAFQDDPGLSAAIDRRERLRKEVEPSEAPKSVSIDTILRAGGTHNGI